MKAYIKTDQYSQNNEMKLLLPLLIELIWHIAHQYDNLWLLL